MDVYRYFTMAAKLALSRGDCRSFLIGTIGIRSDGKLVKSINSPVMERPCLQIRPRNCRKAHAEFKLSKKLDYYAIVYVVRVKSSNLEYGIARPCHDCRKALIARKVRKVYYTIDNNRYGVWYPATNIDKIYYVMMPANLNESKFPDPLCQRAL